jgi:putative transposase
VNRLCEVFEVHRSSYRAWMSRPKEMSAEELHLRERIKMAHQLSNGSAGSRTIARIVTDEGLPLSRYRATKRMAAMGLVSSQQPKHRYRKVDQPHVGIPNLLERQFNVEVMWLYFPGHTTSSILEG